MLENQLHGCGRKNREEKSDEKEVEWENIDVMEKCNHLGHILTNNNNDTGNMSKFV